MPQLARLVLATSLLAAPLAARAQSASVGQLLAVNGAQLFVTVEGRGRPVVLLHGGFMDSSMWAPQIEALRSEFQVIRIDLRGYGKSPRSSEPYSAEHDIAAVLDHLKVKQAAVVGLSMGGGLAIDFALTHPERVRSLLLAEPGLSGWEWSSDVSGTMMRVADAFKKGGRAAAIDAMLEQPVFATARARPAAYAAIREQLERNFSMDAVPMKMARPLAVGRLPEIRVPVLVLVAEQGGPDARRIAEKIAREAPDARAVTMPDTGHMINLEQPAAFNRLALEFLRAH